MARRRSRRRLEPLPVLPVPITGKTAPLSAPAAKFAPPTLQSTLVFLGVVLYLGTTVFRLGVQEFNLLKQGRLLEEEKVAIAAQHENLQAQIAAARTNAGIERLAREQLGFVMAQEIPVKTIVPPTAAPKAVPVAVAAQPHPEPPTAPRDEQVRVGLPPAMAALSKHFLALWR